MSIQNVSVVFMGNEYIKTVQSATFLENGEGQNACILLRISQLESRRVKWITPPGKGLHVLL